MIATGHPGCRDRHCKAGKMIRAPLVALSLLSAAPAPVVGQPTPFDSAEEEEVLQVVAVLVVHARECNNSREYKQNAETMRQSFSQNAACPPMSAAWRNLSCQPR